MTYSKHYLDDIELHRQWTASVGQPGYVKADWMKREKELHIGCRSGCLLEDMAETAKMCWELVPIDEEAEAIVSKIVKENCPIGTKKVVLKPRPKKDV